MHNGQVLAEGVAGSKALLARYLAGFDDSNHTRQAPGLPNHVAWTLGHLALVLNRVGNAFASNPATMDGPLPGADFIKGTGASGDPVHFDSESVAFASTPKPDPTLYPTYARCVAIFDGACDRLGGLLRESSDAKLQETIKWGPAGIVIPLHQVAMRMIFHNGTHTGQIADLRRAFGFKSIFS